MIYESREITCRDGRSCILRSAAVTDANDLIRYLKVTIPLRALSGIQVTRELQQGPEH